MDAFFGPAGRLSGALAGFEPRPEQQTLASEVADALESGDHLVAEAGTGTGKSLAYLVPVLLSGQRVVVATATKALQEQLLTKDVPAAAAASSKRCASSKTTASCSGRTAAPSERVRSARSAK
jgi:ATP-dependent DNA helicase DinG